LRLGGTSQTSYTSPLGTPVNTKINIPNFDPGLYGQLMAMGLPASSDSTARAISVYDGRLSAHYPSIQAVSPNESQVGGFSWEGSNTTFRVKNSSTTIAFNVGGFDAANIRDAGGSDTIMELGVGSSKNGQLSFLNSTNSNFVIMQAGATTAANLFITLPTGVGTTGQCLALASAVSPNETLGYSDCLTTGTGVQLQASTPGSQQTGNINVSGKVVAGTALSSALLDNSGTLGIGTANATTTTIGRSGQTVNFAGDNVNINSGGSMAISGTTTVNNYRLFVGGTLNSATTTSQYGFQNESSFNPAGASLTNLYNNSNVLNVSGSSVNIANAISVHASITTAAGYTGQINDARAISVSAPTISGSQLFPTYTGVYINGSAQNTGNTSGTIVNRGIFLGGNTAAAAGGGTMNNYAMYLTQPAGSGAGTTNNYGIYITGNGGGTSNYSIYNSSTAASYLAGDLRVGTTSNPSGYAVNVQGTMNATTMQATTAVIAESSGPGGTAGFGKLYVSSTDHQLHFVNASGSDLTIGSHTKSVTLVPQYPGGVINPDGTNNTGTMSNGYASGLTSGQGYKHNYYSWVTSQASAQDDDIVLQYQLPSDFSSFVSNSWKIWTYADSLTSTAIAWSISSATGASCYAGTQSALPASGATWEQISLSNPGNGCTFAAGDVITVDIKPTAITPSGNQVRVGEFTYQYVSAY
jgi:hypothetical protein